MRPEVTRNVARPASLRSNENVLQRQAQLVRCKNPLGGGRERLKDEQKTALSRGYAIARAPRPHHPVVTHCGTPPSLNDGT